jgi:hypothetical protein
LYVNRTSYTSFFFLFVISLDSAAEANGSLDAPVLLVFAGARLAQAERKAVI